MSWWRWSCSGWRCSGRSRLLTPGGFFVFFFGVGALLVGCSGVGRAPGLAALQWLLFSVLSVGSLLLFRRRLLALFRRRRASWRDASTRCAARSPCRGRSAPGAIGKAELRGTSWTVRNAGEHGAARRPALPGRARRRPDAAGARRVAPRDRSA